MIDRLTQKYENMKHALPFAIVLAMMSVMPTTLLADRVYQYHGADGQVLFTDKDIAPQQFKLVSVRNYGWRFNAAPVSRADRNRYNSDIKLAAKRFAVSPALIKAIMHAESHFDPMAVSRAGARGLMQLMSATAASLNVTDSFNARANIMGGAELIRFLQQRLDNPDHVLAAYNAGIGNVNRYKGIPPFPETINYVAKVNELLPIYQAEFGESSPSLATR